MQVVIIGVGAAGSMAAWRLADTGQDVIALDQFRIDHDKGSSYGDSRIVPSVSKGMKWPCTNRAWAMCVLHAVCVRLRKLPDFMAPGFERNLRWRE